MADIDDLDNLFEEYESRSRPEGNENVSGDETPVVNERTEEKTPERVPVPVRRIVRNPRLKFNPDRLCGERGIPVLPKTFKNVKFKGKGHEKEDLDKLLSTLNHWCHRLFPSMKFEDCLRQIEKLGKKRPVQTCLHKMRHDMPILNDDFIGKEVEREGDEPEVEGGLETNPEDAFDRLFNEGPEHSAANFASTPIRPQSTENTLGTSFGSTLTEEQKKRIEYNRSLAIERRKNKLASTQSSSMDVSFDNSSSNLIELEPSHSGKNNVNTENAAECRAEGLEVQPPEVNDSANLSNNEGNKILNMKDSEELDIDELMDLVDDNLSEKSATESMQDISSVDNVNHQPNLFKSMECNSSELPFETTDSVIPESDGLEGMEESNVST